MLENGETLSRVKKVANRLVTRPHRWVLARQATSAVVRLHCEHRFGSGIRPDQISDLRIKVFALHFGEAMYGWTAEHDFATGPMKFAGEFHPDARLIAFAQMAGISDPLDAFPLQHEVTITAFGVEMRQLVTTI